MSLSLQGDAGQIGAPGPAGEPGAPGQPGMDGAPGERGSVGQIVSSEPRYDHTMPFFSKRAIFECYLMLRVISGLICIFTFPRKTMTTTKINQNAYRLESH